MNDQRTAVVLYLAGLIRGLLVVRVERVARTASLREATEEQQHGRVPGTAGARVHHHFSHFSDAANDTSRIPRKYPGERAAAQARNNTWVEYLKFWPTFDVNDSPEIAPTSPTYLNVRPASKSAERITARPAAAILRSSVLPVNRSGRRRHVLTPNQACSRRRCKPRSRKRGSASMISSLARHS